MELHRLMLTRIDFDFNEVTGKGEDSASEPEFFVAESDDVVAILGEEREITLRLGCDEARDDRESEGADNVEGIFFLFATPRALTAPGFGSTVGCSNEDVAGGRDVEVGRCDCCGASEFEVAAEMTQQQYYHKKHYYLIEKNQINLSKVDADYIPHM
jgi:hypothetical protein